jgi:hypothetical protein
MKFILLFLRPFAGAVSNGSNRACFRNFPAEFEFGELRKSYPMKDREPARLQRSKMAGCSQMLAFQIRQTRLLCGEQGLFVG